MRLSDATVLVIDDEPDLLEIFSVWLRRQGCRILTAENGVAGLEIAAKSHVDIVVSDVRMPIMDGIEMVKRLKSAGGYVPKIVFVSGFSDLIDRDAFDLGVQATIPKPLRRNDLISTVQQALKDNEERWQAPPAGAAENTLDIAFESLAAAQQQGAIGFGRSGFCVRSRSAAQAGASIGLNIAFKADRHTLTGQGIVRWNEPMEELLGIEITHVADDSRAWVADLTERSESNSCIPRTGLGMATQRLPD